MLGSGLVVVWVPVKMYGGSSSDLSVLSGGSGKAHWRESEGAEISGLGEDEEARRWYMREE